jgi:glycosyltransferase involved in cell wall biosynthesis
LGEVTTEALWKEYSECRALLFSADEDFGMVPLEAQACGRPIVAYGAGGSLETIRGDGPSPTGLYFQEQTVNSIADGILRFESLDAIGSFQPEAIQEWAAEFATPVFLQRFGEFVMSKVPNVREVMSENRVI